MPNAAKPNGPRHVVLIPDGNRRWARQRNRPAMTGHKAGAEAIDRVLEKALDLNIPYVTWWGASTNNVLKRSRSEVAFLYKIFSEYFKKAAKDKRVHENEVRIEVLGRWRELFPASLRRDIEKAIEATGSYNKRHLTILLAYSGVEEMTAAVKSIAAEARRDPRLSVKPETITSHLWSRDLPPVDLVIRTGGEPHWSAGMLMWHVAEAQLHFTPTLWPDFGPEEFAKIVGKYEHTERRLGA